MFVRVCLALLLVILGVGCRQDISIDKEMKWEGISRVFMHEPHHFSFFVEKEKGQLELITIQNSTQDSNCGRAKPNIIADVPEGKPMWATAKKGAHGKVTWYYGLEIHIRVAKDVDGGGWEKREGKTTRKGQTNVIE